MDRLKRHLKLPEFKELEITARSTTSSIGWEEFVNAEKELHFSLLFC